MRTPIFIVDESLLFCQGEPSSRAFEGFRRSPRHKSGIAVRFPRILRWRDDKKPSDADSLETIRAMLPESAS